MRRNGCISCDIHPCIPQICHGALNYVHRLQQRREMQSLTTTAQWWHSPLHHGCDLASQHYSPTRVHNRPSCPKRAWKTNADCTYSQCSRSCNSHHLIRFIYKWYLNSHFLSRIQTFSYITANTTTVSTWLKHPSSKQASLLSIQ